MEGLIFQSSEFGTDEIYANMEEYIMQKKCIALRELCVCQMKSMPSSDLKEYSVRLTAMHNLIQKLQNLASLLIVTELQHSMQS